MTATPAAPVGYRAAHARVATVNGPAHRHACRHCQRTYAADWAYNHNAAHELVSPDGLLYSLNPHDYIPLCRRCHRRFDDLFRPRRRDARGRYIPSKDAMTATATTVSIPHAAACKRPAPVLRLSWRQEPELWCPGCGRSTALPTPAPVNPDESPLDPRAARPTTP